VSELHPLDNAVWSSLGTHQGSISETVGSARRYPPGVNVFYGVEHCDEQGWADLAALAGPSAVVVLFRDEVPPPPDDWTALGGGQGYQMVLDGTPAPALPDAEIRSLTDDHAPAMFELATATKPGPFQVRTHELGRFSGVFDGDRLVAMAGERMHLPGYREISAVCTDPIARGRGLAAALTAHVATGIIADGEQPILHVAGDNHNARRVYERLGFVTRRMLHFTALRTPAESASG
jgi:ribosomal protein S18 acetylase RimI-like enzyme